MSSPKENDDKHPPKSILKNPKQGSRQKSFQWDEVNILQTYHPADKTYGHMKIDEPKTPYVYETEDGRVIQAKNIFSPEDLAARLTATSQGPAEGSLPRSVLNELDTEESEHQKQFREKRAAHYNEFSTIKMAREKIASEAAEEDEDPQLKKAQEEAARNARMNAEMSRQARAQMQFAPREKPLIPPSSPTANSSSSRPHNANDQKK